MPAENMNLDSVLVAYPAEKGLIQLVTNPLSMPPNAIFENVAGSSSYLVQIRRWVIEFLRQSEDKPFRYHLLMNEEGNGYYVMPFHVMPPDEQFIGNVREAFMKLSPRFINGPNTYDVVTLIAAIIHPHYTQSEFGADFNRREIELLQQKYIPSFRDQNIVFSFETTQADEYHTAGIPMIVLKRRHSFSGKPIPYL